MTNFVLQSRKKKVDIIITCQLFSSIDMRIRTLTDYRIIPHITKWLKYPNIIDAQGNIKKIPLSLRLKKLDVFNSKLTHVNIKDIRPVLDTYDTYEIADGIDNSQEITNLTLEYAGWTGSKTALKSKLENEHKLKPSVAGSISNYVCSFTKEEVFNGLGYELPKEENKIMV